MVVSALKIHGLPAYILSMPPLVRSKSVLAAGARALLAVGVSAPLLSGCAKATCDADCTGGAGEGGGAGINGAAGGAAGDTAGIGGDAGAAAGGSAAGGAAGETAAGGAAGGNARFEDDFEAYAVKQLAYQDKFGFFSVAQPMGATMAIDTTKAHSGTKALHIQVEAGGGKRAIVNFAQPVLPRPGNVLYARAMIFLSRNPRGGTHWNYFSASGVRVDPVNGRVQGLEWFWGGHNSGLQAFYSQGDCAYRQGTHVMPEGHWNCWQWKFDGDEAAHNGRGWMTIWRDGNPTPVLEMKGIANICGASPAWLAPNFTGATLGWVHAQDTSFPIEVWIDDVAFGDQMIECPANFVAP